MGAGLASVQHCMAHVVINTYTFPLAVFQVLTTLFCIPSETIRIKKWPPFGKTEALYKHYVIYAADVSNTEGYLLLLQCQCNFKFAQILYLRRTVYQYIQRTLYISKLILTKSYTLKPFLQKPKKKEKKRTIHWHLNTQSSPTDETTNPIFMYPINQILL